MQLEVRDFVAGYAALVATIALGWQVWSSYRARRPQVSVLLDTWRFSREGHNPKSLAEVKIRIRNREDYPVWVEKLDFAHPILFAAAPIPATLKASDIGGIVEPPFDVPARDVVSVALRPSRPYWRYSRSKSPPTIRMELRTGERYRSKSTH